MIYVSYLVVSAWCSSAALPFQIQRKSWWWWKILARRLRTTHSGKYSYLNYSLLHHLHGWWRFHYNFSVQFGKKQLFILGSNLRKRYEHFLVPHSDSVNADVKAVTTDVVRCYQSAGFLLAGLYPPSLEQRWSEELNWQPVPIVFKSADRGKVTTL